MEETTRVVEGKPEYDKYLPGPIQALVEWIIFIIATLKQFFEQKNGAAD